MIVSDPEPGTVDPHRHDGDPTFDALVFGWTCSTKLWNGQSPGVNPRPALAGYFDQYLEQAPRPAVGERVMHLVRPRRWLHGEVVESSPQVIRVRWDRDSATPHETGTFAAHRFHALLLEPTPAVRR